MKTINFYNYAYDAIHNSIIALDNYQDIVDYYGDKKECTIESYFSAQSDGKNIYDSTDEFSEHTLLGSIDDFREDFELAREAAFSDFMNDWNEE